MKKYTVTLKSTSESVPMDIRLDVEAKTKKGAIAKAKKEYLKSLSPQVVEWFEQ